MTYYVTRDMMLSTRQYATFTLFLKRKHHVFGIIWHIDYKELRLIMKNNSVSEDKIEAKMIRSKPVRITKYKL